MDKRDAYEEVCSREARPTHFTIGEMGQYFRTDFAERRNHWASVLLNDDLRLDVKVKKFNHTLGRV